MKRNCIPTYSLPEITTNGVTSVLYSIAQCGGSVKSDGGGTINAGEYAGTQKVPQLSTAIKQ